MVEGAPGVAREPFQGPCGRPVKREATNSARVSVGTGPWRHRCIAPVAAMAPCGEAGATPIRRWGKPEDIGRAVRAIAEDRFPFSTGACFDVDGGFHLQRL